jgi:hypothetical protein
MALSYTIDVARRIVTTRAFGTMSDSDVQILRTQFESDRNVDPTYAQCTDLRELKAVALSAVMVGAFQRALVFRPSGGRVFIARTALQLWLARQLLTIAESGGRPLPIFRTATAAEAWLRRGNDRMRNLSFAAR